MEFLLFIGFWFFVAWLSSNSDGESSGEGSGSYLPPFSIRKRFEKINEDDRDSIIIECQGVLPNIYQKTNISVIVSIFDVTVNDERHPVLCSISDFQEKDSIVFRSNSDLGEMDYQYGYKSWVPVGFIPPLDYLQTPTSGQRELEIIVRIVDTDNPPDIQAGFISEGSDSIYVHSIKHSHHFSNNGYVEETEIEDKAMDLSIKLAMAVAMSDGSLDQREANLIKEWISKRLDTYTDNKRESMKETFNKSLKSVYEMNKEGTLDINPYLNKFNSLNNENYKITALELCYDVMAADQIVDPKEIKILNDIGKKLNVDKLKIESIRDLVLRGIDLKSQVGASTEEILGIQPDWDKSQIIKHLTKEFQKWNNRISVLQDGDQKDNAQNMLDLIGKARRKYG